MFQIALQMPDHGSEDIERILQKIKNKVTQKIFHVHFHDMRLRGIL